MTPEEVLHVVQKVAAPDLELTLRDIDMLKRYFLYQYCKWLPLRKIAELTGAKHYTTTLSSIRATQANQKYLLPIKLIGDTLDDMISVKIKAQKV